MLKGLPVKLSRIGLPTSWRTVSQGPVPGARLLGSGAPKPPSGPLDERRETAFGRIVIPQAQGWPHSRRTGDCYPHRTGECGSIDGPQARVEDHGLGVPVVEYHTQREVGATAGGSKAGLQVGPLSHAFSGSRQPVEAGPRALKE